jgi:electron transport complex protein RnfC
MLRKIKIDWKPQRIAPLELTFAATDAVFPGLEQLDAATFPDFLDEIGLIGMGGSGFPASEKIRSASDIHTLIINGAECEPGITIDQSILLNDVHYVHDGAQAYAEAVGAEKIILAIRDDKKTVARMRDLYPDFEMVTLPDRYPAGAEKLILKKVTGSMPSPGSRPNEMGYIVQNVASLRAIGRAVIDGVPVIERPLSFVMPSTGFYKNLVVPLEVTAQQMIDRYKLHYKPNRHVIIESGLMMGREIQPDDVVSKTTTSLIILKREKIKKEERPCIRCGACNAACPLGLHPFAITEKARRGKILEESYQGQMTECFLCGVCAAVCPSDIPLTQLLQGGKECL